MEQQNPASFRAAVVSSTANPVLPNAVFVPDHKIYFAAMDSFNEAHYLCGFLNSRPVRTWLGGFLARKQIGTTVFEYMKVPRFDPNNDHCLSISAISKVAHKERKGSTNKRYLDADTEEVLSEHVRALCKNS
jgi:hypothetical protein